MSAKLKWEVVISEICVSKNVTILTFYYVICEILLLVLLPTFSFNTIPVFFRYDKCYPYRGYVIAKAGVSVF